MLDAEVRFLAAAGDRHEAIGPAGRPAAGLRGRTWRVAPAEHETDVSAEGARRPARRLLCASPQRRWATAMFEVALRVENRTVCAERARPGRRARPVAALDASRCCGSPAGASSRRSSGRAPASTPSRCSPTPADDAVLGAAIVLPDHPQIAPESRGGLFDSTEIEEALLLHVQALSDAEREEIERAGPAVREMVARAAAATPRTSSRFTGA